MTRQRRRSYLLRAVAIAICTLLIGFSTGNAVAQDQQGFTDEETQSLAAGKLVTRPLRIRRGSLDLIGGSSWQVIDATPEVVWRALHDADRYTKMLPGVKEARMVAQQGGERHVYIRQGAWPVFTSYHAVLRSDPSARALEFELDRRRPHKLNAGWGFARLIPYHGSKTLMAFGMLADVEHGLLAAVGRSLLQKWMLKVPSTVKHFLEHEGSRLY